MSASNHQTPEQTSYQTSYQIVAMDGPAGSGKSTVAKILAEKLGYIHADSGAMYRTVTLALMERLGAGETLEDFNENLKKTTVDFASLGCEAVLDQGRQSNRIQNQDVGDRIRTPEVTRRIKFIADNGAYREAVNKLLRNFGRQTNLVVDGRDIGTVVFPNCPYKFFITASPRVRAERRLKEFQNRGEGAGNIDELEQEIVKRDEEDQNRTIGALKQAEDAILIDTSSLPINDVVSRLLSLLQVKL